MQGMSQCSSSLNERGASGDSCQHGILRGHGTHKEDDVSSSEFLNSVISFLFLQIISSLVGAG